MKHRLEKFTNRTINQVRLKLLQDKKLRQYILNRDNYSCSYEGCEVDYSGVYNSNLKTVKKMIAENPLEIHHVVSLGKDMYDDYELNELSFDPCNMITLCKHCHKEVTGKSKQYIDYFMSLIKERENL